MIIHPNRIISLLIALLVIASCRKPDNTTSVIEFSPESLSVLSTGIILESSTTTNPGAGAEPITGQPQSQVLNFTAPTAWTASIEATKAVDWLEVEPSSGPAGPVEMRVTAQPNETYEDRAATVIIKSGEASASFTVKQAGKLRPVEVMSVSLDHTDVSLTEGESLTLMATVSPDNAADKTVSWSSDNTAVATVDGDGKVTAVAGGEATITAKAGEKTATCKVTVTAKSAPEPEPEPQPAPAG